MKTLIRSGSLSNLIATGKLSVCFTIWIVLFACQSGDFTSKKNQLLNQTLDSLVESSIQLRQIPGAVLLVSQSGEIKHHKAYGHAQLFEYGLKPLEDPSMMTIDHRYDLASLTKVFATTLGIMLLVDREHIALDDTVHLYLKKFRDQHKDSITIRHLLTHTSGLHPWKPVYYHARNKNEAYQYICDLPLAYPVGQGRHYSDLGFMLLGCIVEEISGRTLDKFIIEDIYDPLSLTQTSFTPERNDGPFAATSHGNPFEKRMIEDDQFGYKCDEDPDVFTEWREYTLIGEVNDGNAFHAHQGVAGHAGLFSNASDLKVLLDLLLYKGIYSGNRILSNEVVESFLTKDRFDNGLGWAMSSDVLPVANLPDGSFGHTGFTGTYVLAIPSAKLIIILLTNRQNLGVDADGYYRSLSNLQQVVSKYIIDNSK